MWRRRIGIRCAASPRRSDRGLWKARPRNSCPPVQINGDPLGPRTGRGPSGRTTALRGPGRGGRRPRRAGGTETTRGRHPTPAQRPPKGRTNRRDKPGGPCGPLPVPTRRGPVCARRPIVPNYHRRRRPRGPPPPGDPGEGFASGPERFRRSVEDLLATTETYQPSASRRGQGSCSGRTLFAELLPEGVLGSPPTAGGFRGPSSRQRRLHSVKPSHEVRDA